MIRLKLDQSRMAVALLASMFVSACCMLSGLGQLVSELSKHTSSMSHRWSRSILRFLVDVVDAVQIVSKFITIPPIRIPMFSGRLHKEIDLEMLPLAALLRIQVTVRVRSVIQPRDEQSESSIVEIHSKVP